MLAEPRRATRGVPACTDPSRRARPADRPHADSAVSRARRRCTRRASSISRRSTTFNLDEFLGLGAGRSAQLSRVHASGTSSITSTSRRRTDQLPRRRGAPDADARMRALRSARSTRAGGIDLHDPRPRRQRPHRLQRAGAALAARTHRVTLDAGDAARQRGAASAATSPRVPREALSMGMATILQRAADRAAGDRRREGACVERCSTGR